MACSTNSLPTWTSDSHCKHHGNSLSFRVGLTHSGCLLFEPADFTLQHGITALVGTNGSGKTSLAKALRCIPGFPSDVRVEYVSTEEGSLSQCHEETPCQYLRQVVSDRLEGLRNQIVDLENASGDIEETANKLADLYEEEEKIEESSEREVQQALDALSFAPHRTKALSQLSSGWRYKCRLVAAFLLHPDLLIIDEPSFLDERSLAWFAQKIKEVSSSTILMLISHKEALLEQLADRILYINSENKTLTSYNCRYFEFKDVLELQRSHAHKKTTLATKQEELAKKSLTDVQKQLRKREGNLKTKTSQNADQRFIKGKNKEAKQKADKSAASRVKQLQRQTAAIEDLQKKAQRERIKPLHIDGNVSAGTLATLDQVSFAYDDRLPLFENVDAKLGPRDRVLLRGPNGCGKSTLIRLILGELQPTEGRLIQQGRKLYFPQTAMSDMMHHCGNQAAVDYLGSDLTETQARHHLGQFGLKGDVALRSIAGLSAGQRVRLWLAAQVRHNPEPSLLILDEISENVDVDTRNSLIELLHSFIGAVLVISHDPDFCDSFHPTQVWTLHPNGLKLEYHDEVT